MIDAERHSCRFLQFELSVGPDLGPLTQVLHVQIETERLRIKANGTLNVFDLISHAPEPHNQRHR
jgi:hypothetical protein